MTRKLVYSPLSIRQLESLYDWIADNASPETASRSESSIRSYCDHLMQFPYMGTARDDIRPGLRTVGYRRRATIAFAVTDNTVEIIGIYYGGRDFESLLLHEEE